jgi:hypothetical protein
VIKIPLPRLNVNNNIKSINTKNVFVVTFIKKIISAPVPEK